MEPGGKKGASAGYSPPTHLIHKWWGAKFLKRKSGFYRAEKCPITAGKTNHRRPYVYCVYIMTYDVKNLKSF